MYLYLYIFSDFYKFCSFLYAFILWVWNSHISWRNRSIWDLQKKWMEMPNVDEMAIDFEYWSFNSGFNFTIIATFVSLHVARKFRYINMDIFFEICLSIWYIEYFCMVRTNDGGNPNGNYLWFDIHYHSYVFYELQFLRRRLLSTFSVCLPSSRRVNQQRSKKNNWKYSRNQTKIGQLSFPTRENHRVGYFDVDFMKKFV